MSRHHSPHSVTKRASTGYAIRRGQIKISDPIPMASAHYSATVPQSPPFERFHSRKAGTWSGGLTHGRSGSASPLAADGAENAAPEPMSPPCPSPTIPMKSPSTRKRETGLRATLKRMLSSKRGSAGKGFDPVVRTASTDLLADSIHTISSPATSPLIVPLRKHSLPTNLLSSESTHEMSFIGSPLPKVEEEIRVPGVRRNTVPSLIIPNDGQNGTSQHVAGCEYSPRPTTAVRHLERGNIQLKRKSKSADDMDAYKQTFPCDTERSGRMSEIAFWRNSVIANPLPTWNYTETPSEAALTRTDRSVLVNSIVPSIVPSIEPVPSMQSFDFGLARGDASGLNASLDERVNTLEVKMIDFEYALANLQGNELTRPLFDYADSHRSRMRRGNSPEGTSAHASPPSTELSSPTSSPQRHGSSFTDDYEVADRTSKATIKASARQTSFDKRDAASTALIRASQYEALLALVRNERSAREMLEMQILTLRKEMEALRRPVQSTFRSNPELTPSPDSLHETIVPRIRLSQYSASFYGSPPMQETSRFSMTESDVETETDYYPEVFETPQESRFPPNIHDEPFAFGMI